MIKNDFDAENLVYPILNLPIFLYEIIDSDPKETLLLDIFIFLQGFDQRLVNRETSGLIESSIFCQAMMLRFIPRQGLILQDFDANGFIIGACDPFILPGTIGPDLMKNLEKWESQEDASHFEAVLSLRKAQWKINLYKSGNQGIPFEVKN